MHTSVGGEQLGILKGTLCSGHRATSFVNSVMNAAYIKMSWPEGWNKMDSLHAGDDVFAKLASYEDVESLINGLSLRKLRINPMKQSVGSVGAEFLRMAITPRCVRGYLCRSISSAISGSWTSSAPLEPLEKLMNAIINSRSLINRSGCDDMYMFCVEGVHQRTKFARRAVANLLSGRYALENGPCYSTDGLRRRYKLVGGVKSEKLNTSGLASKATGTYLSRVAKPYEVAAIVMTGANITGKMMEASYAKSLSSSGVRVTTNNFRLVEEPPQLVSGGAAVEDVNKTEAPEGLLSSSPIIKLLEKMLTKENLRSLLSMLGVKAHNDVFLQCFGPDKSGNNIVSPMSYADAAATGKRCGNRVIYGRRPSLM